MSDNLLVVYNVCERQRTNLFWYISCLDSLLEQDYPNFKIIVSGCAMSHSTKAGLRKRYGNRLWYKTANEMHTVNVTFNHSVRKVAEQVGGFNGYIFVDSGMNTRNQTFCLSEIGKRSSTRKYGMVTLQSDNDRGFYLPHTGVRHDHIFTGTEDIEVLAGEACNLHFQYFDDALLKQYGGLMPDIFKAHCTESTFSFLNAALRLKWVVVPNIVLEHYKSIDRPMEGYGDPIKARTVAFDEHGPFGKTWNNLYNGVDVHTCLITDEAKALGMGYEECGNIMMHDPSLYDEEGFPKNPKLKDFIRDNLFLKPSVLDYNKIPCETTIE